MHGFRDALLLPPQPTVVDFMNLEDEQLDAKCADICVDQLTALVDQSSIYPGRAGEQRALDRLRKTATTARAPKISSQDLKAIRNEERLERVFNKEFELTKEETRLDSLKKDLHKARGQKKNNLALKKAQLTFGALSVPFMFGLATIAMVVTSMSQIESRAYARQAQNALAKGDQNAAYANYRRSLLWNPYSVEANLAAGRINEKRQDREEAYRHFERALKLDPNNVELLDRKGALAIKLNRFGDAAETYSHLLKVSQNARKKLHHFGNRAIAYSKLGEFDKAIDDYTSLLKMKRKDQSAFIGRAFCRSELKEYKAALADLNRLLEINPTHYEGLLLKGWVDQSLSNFKAAHADFALAAAAQPKNEKAYIYTAHLLRATGDNRGALEQLDHVIGLNPVSREAHTLKGQVLLALNLPKEALDEFRTADGFKTEENYFSLLDRARAYQGAGENHQAISVYSKLIALKPELCELRFERARVEQNAHEFKKAINDLNEAIKLYPNYTQAILKRAECNIAVGNNVSAVQDFHLAIKSAPYDAKPYIAFGKFNLHKQQFVTAKECFDKAIAFDSKNETAKQLSVVAAASLQKLVGKHNVSVDEDELSRSEVADIASSNYAELIEKGYDAIKDNKLAFAEAALEKAVRLDPNSKVARRYLVSVLLTEGKVSQAEAQVDALQQMGAAQADDKIRLAAAYKKSGNCRKAIKHLELHIATNPADLKAQVELCDAYAALGNTDKAAEVCLGAMNQSKGRSIYASLRERYLSLKETQERVLERKQINAGNNETADTQG
jgi:tetratricopeptide (TPR) repeat protein